MSAAHLRGAEFAIKIRGEAQIRNASVEAELSRSASAYEIREVDFICTFSDLPIKI